MGDPMRVGESAEAPQPRPVPCCGWPTGKTTFCDVPVRTYKRDGRTYTEGLCAYHGDIEFSARWQARWREASDDWTKAKLRRELDGWKARGRTFYGPQTDRQFVDRRAGND